MAMNKIRKKRRALGLSQFELEKITNISRNKIALHEQGYRPLPKKTEDLIIKSLNQMEKKDDHINK